MKKFSLLIVAVVLFFTACKKQEEAPLTGNYMRVGNETIRLSGGAQVISQGIVFYSYDQFDMNDMTGKYSTATLYIDTLAVGTYTYKPLNDTGHVTGKNFSGFQFDLHYGKVKITGQFAGALE